MAVRSRRLRPYSHGLDFSRSRWACGSGDIAGKGYYDGAAPAFSRRVRTGSGRDSDPVPTRGCGCSVKHRGSKHGGSLWRFVDLERGNPSVQRLAAGGKGVDLLCRPAISRSARSTNTKRPTAVCLASLTEEDSAGLRMWPRLLVSLRRLGRASSIKKLPRCSSVLENRRAVAGHRIWRVIHFSTKKPSGLQSPGVTRFLL